MSVELESHDVFVKRSLYQRLAGAGLTVAGLLGFLYGIWVFVVRDGSLVPFYGLAGVVVGVMLLATTRRDPHTRSGKEGRLRVDTDTGELVVHPSGRRIALADMEGAWLEEDFVGGALVVETNDGVTVAARFREGQQAEADRLIQALGADARVVRMRLARSERVARGVAGGCMAASATIGSLLLLGLFVASVDYFNGVGSTTLLAVFGIPTLVSMAVVLGMSHLLRTTDLHVGTDGVRVRDEFVPYSSMRHVWAHELGVTIEHAEGLQMIRCLAVQAEAVFRRVEQGMQRYQARNDQETELQVLDRGSRPVQAWRDALAGLLDGGAYRSRALDKEELLEVVDNPRAATERRVGAILALGPRVQGEDRERIRIAVEGCAEANARQAMEAALEEELHLVETALARGD